MSFWKDWGEALEQGTTIDNIRKRRELAESQERWRQQRLEERRVRALERAAGIPDGYDP